MKIDNPYKGKSNVLEHLWEEVHYASKDDFREDKECCPISFNDAADILGHIEKLEEYISTNNPGGSIGKVFTTPVEFKGCPNLAVVAWCPHCLTYGSPMGIEDRVCGNCQKGECRMYQEIIS